MPHAVRRSAAFAAGPAVRCGAVIVACLYLIGCTRDPKDYECDTGTECDACCISETLLDSGFGLYGYGDENGATVNDNRTTWAHVDGRPVSVEVNADVDSIVAYVTDDSTGAPLTRAEAEDAVTEAFAYWNRANAGVELSAGSLEVDCCNSLSEAYDGVCTDCLHNGQNDIFFWNEDNSSPAEMAPGFSGTCLVTADVVFYGAVDDGTFRCDYNWGYPYLSGDLDECVDGTEDKPFRHTLIHELGHLLGIEGDLDIHPKSAVSYGCADSAGCSYSTVSNLDIHGLEALYAQCSSS